MRPARPSYFARFRYLLGCPRMLLIGAFGTVLEAIYQIFFGFYQFAIWRKERYFEDLCLFQTGAGNKVGLGVYGADPIKPTGPSRCKGEQNETL